jgi:hypothetical protein
MVQHYRHRTRNKTLAQKLLALPLHALALFKKQ